MLRERLAKLLCVKSVVTLLLTGAFVYLVVAGQVSAQEFMPVFTMVVSFYFGTQIERRDESGK